MSAVTIQKWIACRLLRSKWTIGFSLSAYRSVVARIICGAIAFIPAVLSAESIPAIFEIKEPYIWIIGTPTNISGTIYMIKRPESPRGSYLDVLTAFCPEYRIAVGDGDNPRIDWRPFENGEGLNAFSCNAYVPGGPNLKNPDPVEFGSCTASCEKTLDGDAVRTRSIFSIRSELMEEYSCPKNQNWTLNGNTCTRPDCTSSEVRNSSGVCVPKEEVILSDPCLGEGNPIDAGTGIKTQTEEFYRSATSPALIYELTYRSTKSGAVNSSAHGVNWINNFVRGLSAVDGSPPPLVYTARQDGSVATFQWDGARYVPQDAVLLYLTRVTAHGQPYNSTLGWELVDQVSEKVEFYDAMGRLKSTMTLGGVMETLNYDTSDRLKTVTNSFGQTLTFDYDPQDRISIITQPDGRTLAFSYDSANNLQSVTFPDEKTRTYHYGDSAHPNSLTGITDENGDRYATWAYDSLGRAYLSEHAGGAERKTLSYGTSSTTVTDARNNVRTVTFDTILGAKRHTGNSQPAGSGCAAASSKVDYYPNGTVKTRTDFNNRVTEYTYADSYWPLRETKRVEAKGTTEERIISTEWRGLWHRPAVVAEPKKITGYGFSVCSDIPFDAPYRNYISNLCTKHVASTSDLTGASGFDATRIREDRAWQYGYNKWGQLTYFNGPRTDVSDITEFFYDAQGNLSERKDALGSTRFEDYDANGRVGKITDPNGLVTTLTYHPRGWVETITVGSQQTAYQYDGVGQIRRVTLPDASYIDFAYDAAHRLRTVRDAVGNEIRYTPDLMSNPEFEEIYDPNGVLAKKLQRVYDPLNRMRQLIGVE